MLMHTVNSATTAEGNELVHASDAGQLDHMWAGGAAKNEHSR